MVHASFHPLLNESSIIQEFSLRIVFIFKKNIDKGEDTKYFYPWDLSILLYQKVTCINDSLWVALLSFFFFSNMCILRKGVSWFDGTNTFLHCIG